MNYARQLRTYGEIICMLFNVYIKTTNTLTIIVHASKAIENSFDHPIFWEVAF